MNDILILSSSYVHKDPRILRQVRALKDIYSIVVCGLVGSNDLDEVENTHLLTRPAKNQNIVQRGINYLKMRFGMFTKLTWSNNVFNDLSRYKCQVVIVNDPREMPLAVKIKSVQDSECKIYFDLHEYFLNVDSKKLTNNVFSKLTTRYFPEADILTTVNEEIAELYLNKLGRKPLIVQNVGPYFELSATEVDNKSIKIVHHGVLNRDRKLEEMVKMMSSLDNRYSLTFYLAGSNLEYLAELKSLSEGLRVQFLDPVPYNDIVPTINKYDIGLFLLYPGNKSLELALPNKLFEFIQARLAIAISPIKPMARVVNKWNIGVVSKDFTSESMAKEITKLEVKDITRMKKRSGEAAKVENETQSLESIRTIVKDLIRQPVHG